MRHSVGSGVYECLRSGGRQPCMRCAHAHEHSIPHSPSASFEACITLLHRLGLRYSKETRKALTKVWSHMCEQPPLQLGRGLAGSPGRACS